MKTTEKTIQMDYLARVEGEGALYLKIADGNVEEASLKIFEPPRFFEAFLRGRSYDEAPDITARICGICPVAYQMSSVHAMEQIFGATITPEIREMRRLLYCGEWIESHALHIFMLHAPDFLGLPDVIHLAKDHRDLVEKALFLKKTGNEVMRILGGREVHPINVRVGGFYRIPSPKEFEGVLADLKRAQEIAYETALWTNTLDFPDFEQDYELVTLHHDEEYALNEGYLISRNGLHSEVGAYESHFHEEHVQRSNALHSTLHGKAYLTGPLARYSLNYDQLSEESRQLANRVGLSRECLNPFKSIVVRAVETFYACEEAIRILSAYRKQPDTHHVPYEVSSGTGCAVTEAPRGMLYHSYSLDDNGIITRAKIVAPTSQNQKIIEEDLRNLATQLIDSDEKTLAHRCEQAIRNYDPCISCATHFLDLTIDRS